MAILVYRRDSIGMVKRNQIRAICYDRYGGRDRLYFGKVPAAEPGPGEVVVRVKTVALNPIDWKLREGQVRWVYPLKFPAVPGFDFCGTILQCGESLEDFTAGDRVCGMSDRRGGGTLAERCLCSATVLARVPDAMTDEEAAGLPLAGLTAYQGLCEKGRLEAGMRVLVVGASGGVGHLAVQVAKLCGGRVTAVCGTENIDWVRDLGADRVIDYHLPDWFRNAGRFDLIFDAVGILGFQRARSGLERHGAYVTTVPGLAACFDQWIRAPLLGHRARTFLVKPSGTGLEKLIRHWSEGRLRIRIARTFEWKDFGPAFAESEGGHAKGKIIVRITA